MREILNRQNNEVIGFSTNQSGLDYLAQDGKIPVDVQALSGALSLRSVNRRVVMGNNGQINRRSLNGLMGNYQLCVMEDIEVESGRVKFALLKKCNTSIEVKSMIIERGIVINQVGLPRFDQENVNNFLSEFVKDVLSCQTVRP